MREDSLTFPILSSSDRKFHRPRGLGRLILEVGLLKLTKLSFYDSMIVRSIDNQFEWEEFLKSIQEKTFLHSWAWGGFQKAMGEQVWRYGIYDNETLGGVMLVIRVEARRGRFLLVPQGPIIENSKLKTQNSKLQFKIQSFVAELTKLAQEEGCGFVRISPILEDTEGNRNLFKNLGFRSAPMHMHAELTWLLDITKSEEELLQGMRKTTRNLVRRGEREGVEVQKGSLDEFYPLFEETAKRQKFVHFSKRYLQKEKESFGEHAQIFLARHKGEILAGAFIVFYHDTAYYHHAASAHSKIPAAYTLQWEIIKQARKRGMKQYNLWGVVPENDTTHPWRGLSLFKRGFGGREWNLMHAQDLALSWKYWISWTVERVRKVRRGY